MNYATMWIIMTYAVGVLQKRTRKSYITLGAASSFILFISDSIKMFRIISISGLTNTRSNFAGLIFNRGVAL